MKSPHGESRPGLGAIRIVAVLLVANAPSYAQSGAYDLLEKVRKTYAELGAYHDRGEIEIAGPPARQTFRFETYAEDATFRLLVEGPDFRRLLWRDAGEARLYDLELDQYQRLSAPGAGLARLLGRESFDVFTVAAAWLSSPAALSAPDAAAFEGSEPCGASTCDLLLLSRLMGTHETLLWIDRETLLIRRLEITLHPADDSLRAALAEAGLEAPPGILTSASGPRTLRVDHEIGDAARPAGDSFVASFVPPASARPVESWEWPVAEPADTRADSAAAAGTEPARVSADSAAAAGAEPTLVFDDTISVELMRITTRVVDPRGHPVLDLGPGDFRARVGVLEIPVVGVDWVSSDPVYRDELLERELARHGVRLEPVEKRVVVFVQTGMHATRIRGHLRTLPFAQELVATLHPNDRVAVVSFDSHLKLWLDFTRRHDEASEAIGEAVLFGNEPRLRRRREGAAAALAESFDFRAARHAATPEQALEVLGRALEAVDGDKVVVYLGWGMGRFGSDGVKMTPDYAPAVRALLRARASVFVLDVTDAGYHSLEIGLRNVAAQTGGTYAKTSLFAGQVTERLARTLTGHYELTLDPTTLDEQRGVLRLELREKKGRIVSDKFRVEKRGR